MNTVDRVLSEMARNTATSLRVIRLRDSQTIYCGKSSIDIGDAEPDTVLTAMASDGLLRQDDVFSDIFSLTDTGLTRAIEFKTGRQKRQLWSATKLKTPSLRSRSVSNPESLAKPKPACLLIPRPRVQAAQPEPQRISQEPRPPKTPVPFVSRRLADSATPELLDEHAAEISKLFGGATTVVIVQQNNGEVTVPVTGVAFKNGPGLHADKDLLRILKAAEHVEEFKQQLSGDRNARRCSQSQSLRLIPASERTPQGR